MKREDLQLVSRAAELRAEFDKSFATEPAQGRAELDNFLGIRVGGDAYAVRLEEVAGLLADRKIVPLPSPIQELLGLTGLRGVVLPTYSLAALLGYPGKPGAMRWLVVARAEHVDARGCAREQNEVGLAFEEFEGHLQLARSELGKSAAGAARSHVRETARFGDELRAIISIPSIMAAVARRIVATRTGKEL
jgi:purine-binding chemotaxis protein CheW